MAPAEHRLKMCRLACKEDGRIKVFDFEIKHKLHGETYNMVKRLLETDLGRNKCDFSFVIGLDNANCFNKWINYKELERLIRFVVVPRSGEKMKRGVNWYLKPPHIYLKPEQPLADLSSTTVRENILGYWHLSDIAHYHLEKQIHPDVYDYIIAHELYKLR